MTKSRTDLGIRLEDFLLFSAYQTHRFAQSETTVYSDTLSIHYTPISNVFDNKEYFSALFQIIKLWHYWEIACSISNNKVFYNCYKKHLKWGRWEVIKRDSPIMCTVLCGSIVVRWASKVHTIEVVSGSTPAHLPLVCCSKTTRSIWEMWLPIYLTHVP